MRRSLTILLAAWTFVSARLALADEAPAPGWHWEFGATGEDIFEHMRASLRDPHFGMRLYRDHQVRGTLHAVDDPDAPTAEAEAETEEKKHLFWDVSFGERLPIFSYYNVDPERSFRYVRGLRLNLDAAAFMLLDFSSQSAGVIDTDFRIGGSLDFRPWWKGWDRFSLSVGFFHESTHLGDEYVLSEKTVQAGEVPSVNPTLPYRANPSYQAVPVLASVDLPLGADGNDDPQWSMRLYGGLSAYFSSDLPNGKFPSEGRLGAELRLTQAVANHTVATPAPPASAAPDGSVVLRALDNLRRRSAGVRAPGTDAPPPQARSQRRGTFAVEAAYELNFRRRYAHVGPEPGAADLAAVDGYWRIHHLVLIGLYNLDTSRSSSNAVGLSLEWLSGPSPFGQLTEYAEVHTVAGGLAYYW
jgi:hypothetical protein